MKKTTALDGSKTTPEPAVDAKPTKRTGRPKTRPDSRQASFHVPIVLLDRIDSEAAEMCGGNKSFLLVKMIEKYFADKDKIGRAHV